MQYLYIMVGIPRSGKSTIAKSIQDYFEKMNKNVSYISSDAIREEILNDVNDQSKNDKIFNEVHNRVYKAIQHKNNIIVDATNIKIKYRASILNYFKDNSDYKKIAYVLTTPIEECKRRNLNKERIVPELVIDKMVRQFEIPFKEEGFDQIYFSQASVENMSYEKLKFNLLAAMKGFNQKNPHHKYTLGEHCQQVAIEIARRSPNKLLYEAALLHDVGKLFVGEPKKADPIIYTYIGHHNYGTYHLLQYIPIFLTEFSLEDTLEILFYINYHMIPFFLNSDKSKKKYLQIFGQKHYDDLILLNKCDKIGSGTEKVL